MPGQHVAQGLPHLILYSRAYCHLCDDMRAALEPFRAQYGFTVDVVDVDDDPGLVARYDELVPVLVARRADGTTVPVCHHFLDPHALAAVLGQAAP